ncbi:MAG: FecR domain-containing protein [Planctomycetota bacterium]|jgi:predicted anti-sigma-YlaC factor YlaD
MITCEKCRELIEEYIEGVIADERLEELKSHTETCDACSEEFERCNLIEDVIKDAFSSETSTTEAGEKVLGRLAEDNVGQTGARHANVLWFGRQRSAVAAAILLAVGLTIGFYLGQMDSAVELAEIVQVHVSDVEGTVLVRHAGMDVWDVLGDDSVIRLGDTFHSMAKSAVTLKLGATDTIELNQNSMLVLKSFNGETQFFLEHGECTAALESPHGPFFINTPHGRVEALGTEFTVTVE